MGVFFEQRRAPQAVTEFSGQVNCFRWPVAQDLIEGFDKKLEAMVDVVWNFERLRALKTDETMKVGAEQPHRVHCVIAFQSITGKGRVNDVKDSVARSGVFDLVLIRGDEPSLRTVRGVPLPTRAMHRALSEGLAPPFADGRSGEDIGGLVLGANGHQLSRFIDPGDM